MPTVQDIKTAIGVRKTGLEAGMKGLLIQIESAAEQVKEIQFRINDLRDRMTATNGAITECDALLAAIDDLEAKKTSEAESGTAAVDDGLPTHMGKATSPLTAEAP